MTFHLHDIGGAAGAAECPIISKYPNLYIKKVHASFLSNIQNK